MILQFLLRYEDTSHDRASGNTKIYPQGLTVDVPDLLASYLLAAGVCSAPGKVPDEVAMAVDGLEPIIDQMRTQGIAATYDAVMMAVSTAAQEEEPPSPPKTTKKAGR